ncbi:phenylacetate--CoA ligase family protein [Kocuria sp. M1R5S2]|uniref:phenylacetate--CoA ligase family protein n=1 Tax=Kocuria rhizosphaerae TaxID=3376285 RepID=UPI0037A5BA75
MLGVAADAWWVEHAGPEAVARRQRARLAALVRHARHASPYYRRLYHGLPAEVTDPRVLPPVDRPGLMARFDEWVTDPRLTLEALHRDVLDGPSPVGARYLGGYHVITTSGTSGEPAVLVHDRASWAAAAAVLRVRARRTALRPEVLGPVLRHGLRTAVLVATGGHFAAVTVAEDLRRRSRAQARRLRVVSVLRPLPEIVAELEEFRPTVLVGYPSVLRLLAGERRAGRLGVDPALVAVGGETLTPAARRAISGSFGCPVLDEYAASEVPALAVECPRAALHVNADRYLFEPVDERLRPVPPGTVSATALVTNLDNRVQPLLRYDLGDSAVLAAGPCPCGSPLPVVRVEGRSGAVLRLRAGAGPTVEVPPLALGTVIGETPGVRRFQAVGTGPETLTVHLEPDPGADLVLIRSAAEARLRAFLDARGLVTVAVRHSPDPPRPDPRSGKFREVWSR